MLQKRIDEIHEILSSSNQTVVLFDRDSDGSMSYLSLKETFSQCTGFPFGKDLEGQLEQIERFPEKTDTVLLIDTPVVMEEVFEKIKDKKVIWVDHHPSNSKELIEKYNIIHLNPLEFHKEDNRPSCYWAYLIAKTKTNLWRVALGSIADYYVLDILEEFYNEDKKLFSLLLPLTDEKREELFEFVRNGDFTDPKFNLAKSEWVDYLSYECGIILYKNFFDLFYKLAKGDDLITTLRSIEKMDLLELKTNLNSGKGNIFEEFSNTMQEYKTLFSKLIKKAQGKEVVFVEHTGERSFNRQLSEEFAYRCKDAKVIGTCFHKEDRGVTACSFRGRQGFVINDIVSNSVKGLRGNGGGHQFAAGLRIETKDFKEFKERFDAAVEERLR